MYTETKHCSNPWVAYFTGSCASSDQGSLEAWPPQMAIYGFLTELTFRPHQTNYLSGLYTAVLYMYTSGSFLIQVKSCQMTNILKLQMHHAQRHTNWNATIQAGKRSSTEQR